MRARLKWILPIATLIVAGLLVTVMILLRSTPHPVPREVPVPTVRTVRVYAEPHQFSVSAQGTVVPRTDIELVAEVSGRVKGVSASFAAGGFFKAGETLLNIDPADYELAVVRARATLAEAQVRLAREQAESEVARHEWDALGSGEGGPLVLREPQLAEAHAAVDAAHAAVQQAELDLARCQISAPFDGRVWEKHADVGQFIVKGANVARVYAVDYAEVPLPLPLDQIGYLDLPMSYRDGTQENNHPEVVLIARFGDLTREWQGRIVRTEGEIDSRTRMLTVVARVDDPYGQSTEEDRPPLSVGLFVHATIAGKEAGRVFLVPRAGIQGRNRVMIVGEDERLHFRDIEVIRFEGDRAVIREGLNEGDRVCVSPLAAPVDGMRVRLVEANEQQTLLKSSSGEIE